MSEDAPEHYRARVLKRGVSFAESPRWHEGRWWYSDFYRHGIYSLNETGDDERLEHLVATQPSGLGWLPQGDLVGVSMTDQRVLRFGNGATTVFADLAPYGGFWSNELITSALGVSYVGDFGFDLDVMIRDGGVQALRASPPPTANLIVLDPSGDVLQVVPELTFPNGTVISRDGSTLIVGETLASRLSAFDVAHDGTLSNRRRWAQLDHVAPDGLCLDADDQLWLADASRRRCLRVKEGGELTGVVETSQRAFACALGGRDGRSLLVTCAPTSSRFEVATQTLGTIEIARVDVAGA